MNAGSDIGSACLEVASDFFFFFFFLKALLVLRISVSTLCASALYLEEGKKKHIRVNVV